MLKRLHHGYYYVVKFFRNVNKYDRYYTSQRIYPKYITFFEAKHINYKKNDRKNKTSIANNYIIMLC